MEKKSTVVRWLGLGLIVLSLAFIPLLAYVPFMPITVKQKAILAGVLVVGGQILTWVGGFLLGKELLIKYRKYLNPRNWFKKSRLH